MPKRLFFVLLLLPFLALFFFWQPPHSSADELDDLNKQISDLTTALNQSVAATKPLESQLNAMQQQISGIKNRVAGIETDLAAKKKDIDDGYKTLGQKEALLNRTIRDFYIKSYYNTPLNIFLSLSSASDVTQMLAYQKAKTNQDKSIITNIALTLTDLEQKRQQLQSEQGRLVTLKASLDAQSQKLDGIIQGAKAYQSQVSGKIAALTARQQEILSAKSGTFTTSVGDVPLADDPNASPSYNPGFSPAFAAFSFGAYTHRNGMSQYGAKGRADSGQSFKDILSHYYPGKTIQEGYSEPATISVDGYGTVDFEDYLAGLGEMPSSWNSEALKAQAVAARSYALSYTNNGQKSICATTSCQVYIGHSKGGAWEQAVKDTKGIVLTDGGTPISAQYSSTTGGYLNTSGWDTKCGSKDCWTADAWEKIAGSPWFYKGWYTQTSSNSSDKCGRSSPWLNQAEMADILNAWLVQGKDGVDGGRIVPISCWGGDPYSMDDLKNLANVKAGGAVTSISSVSVSYSSGGSTATVSFATNKGTVSVSGSDFLKIFNLRAPGYISIKSPLFNIEHK